MKRVHFDGVTGAVLSEEDIPHVAAPLVLSATAFQDTAETALGVNGIGRARFGEIIRAMQTNRDDEVLAVFKRYDKSLTFEKTKVAAMLNLLKSKGIIKGASPGDADERTAILAAWPTA